MAQWNRSVRSRAATVWLWRRFMFTSYKLEQMLWFLASLHPSGVPIIVSCSVTAYCGWSDWPFRDILRQTKYFSSAYANLKCELASRLGLTAEAYSRPSRSFKAVLPSRCSIDGLKNPTKGESLLMRETVSVLIKITVALAPIACNAFLRGLLLVVVLSLLATTTTLHAQEKDWSGAIV